MHTLHVANSTCNIIRFSVLHKRYDELNCALCMIDSHVLQNFYQELQGCMKKQTNRVVTLFCFLVLEVVNLCFNNATCHNA